MKTTYNNRYILVFLLSFLGLAPQLFAQESATVCVDHYPPLQVINPDGSVEGYNVSVLEALAERANIKLEYKTDVPFSRCLYCMQTGSCDLMIGLLDVDDRRDYMELFQYSGQSDKVFYVHQTNPRHIDSFADLKDLIIGVNRGYRYFQQFDRETRLFEKVYVDSREQLFRMLISKRVDAIICNFEICESFIQAHPEWQGQIRRVSYNYTKENPSYIGLSKKSKLMSQKSELANVIAEMFLSGEVEAIVDRYSRVRPNK